jgi:hypothetical protein
VGHDSYHPRGLFVFFLLQTRFSPFFFITSQICLKLSIAEKSVAFVFVMETLFGRF